MNWYAKTTSNDQGLIIDEDTGANIAVSYDAKHAPLIAAAPKMLAALEAIEARVNGDFDNPELVAIGPLHASCATDCERIARAAISQLQATFRKPLPDAPAHRETAA